MKIIFRADASLEMGSGHVMRCLTLANALRARGAACRFACRAHEGNLSEYISAHGFHVDLLPSAIDGEVTHHRTNEDALYAHWLGASQQQDAAETIQCIDDALIDWVVVDHYGIDREWEQALRPYTKKILVIDDLANRYHDCDVLLDQNLVNNFASRYDELVPEPCDRLLGPEYAMLQPEYAELHPRTPPRIGPVSRLLIYFGGADVNNLTGLTLEALINPVFADLDMDVVVNPRSPHYKEVCDTACNHASIHIHDSLPSLARLIMQADLAIGAGGTTSWERCCLGLPAIVVTLADNQVAIASELSKRDLVTCLGDQSGITVELIRRAIQCEIEDSERLHKRSVECKMLVDGKGVNRVADRVMLNSQTHLVARLATLDDEDLLLNWANDSLVRKHSFNPQPIDPVTHRKWFFKRLRNIDRCALYIVQTESGMPLGQVRFEKCENAWEIHYGLASCARGRGLGRPILRAALHAFQTTICNPIFFGRVKHDNVASRRIFEGLGFTENAGVAGELVFQKRFC